MTLELFHMKLVDSAVNSFKSVTSDEKVNEVINLLKVKENRGKVSKRTTNFLKVVRGGGDEFRIIRALSIDVKVVTRIILANKSMI